MIPTSLLSAIPYLIPRMSRGTIILRNAFHTRSPLRSRRQSPPCVFGVPGQLFSVSLLFLSLPLLPSRFPPETARSFVSAVCTHRLPQLLQHFRSTCTRTLRMFHRGRITNEGGVECLQNPFLTMFVRILQFSALTTLTLQKKPFFFFFFFNYKLT